MFCPKCDTYLEENDLIKLNIVYAPGNVAVEYDAQCPSCQAEMGRVFWGQLAVNPELTRKNVVTPMEPKRRAAEDATDLSEASREAKRCPHCGMRLPEGF